MFSFILNHEVHKATRLQYCLSLLCLTPDLTPGETAPALTNRMARVILGQLRATDLASTFPTACVLVLLIDSELRNLPAILSRLKDAVEPFSVGPRGRERHFTLSAGGGAYPQTATNGSELFRQSVDLMARAQAEGGNRLYLPP